MLRRWYDANRPSYHGWVLLVDAALIVLFAVTAAVVDQAIMWVLLGMMLMRLAADYGHWQRTRRPAR